MCDEKVAFKIDMRKNAGFVINALNEPEEIGSFSIDENGEILYNSPVMKRYYYSRGTGNIELDLNEGYDENFQLRSFTDQNIDNILNWIKYEGFKPVMSQPLVITSRSTIAKLLCTPYCRNSYSFWRIYASKFRDTIYLISIDTEEHKARDDPKDEKNRRTTYWGFKFEQYMTTEDPNRSPDLKSRCYGREMFCIVAKNKIGDHTLLFRADMDAIKPTPRKPRDTSHYVELKTCAEEGMAYKYSYKPLKIWASNTVVGVEDIVCGFKNASGMITRIEEYETQALPRMFQRDRKSRWLPEVCFRFLNTFLNHLKFTLPDNHKTVKRFDYKGGNNIWVRNEDDAAYQIVSDEYVREYNRYKGENSPFLDREPISCREAVCTLPNDNGGSPAFMDSGFSQDQRYRCVPPQYFYEDPRRCASHEQLAQDMYTGEMSAVAKDPTSSQSQCAYACDGRYFNSQHLEQDRLENETSAYSYESAASRYQYLYQKDKRFKSPKRLRQDMPENEISASSSALTDPVSLQSQYIQMHHGRYKHPERFSLGMSANETSACSYESTDPTALRYQYLYQKDTRFKTRKRLGQDMFENEMYPGSSSLQSQYFHGYHRRYKHPERFSPGMSANEMSVCSSVSTNPMPSPCTISESDRRNTPHSSNANPNVRKKKKWWPNSHKISTYQRKQSNNVATRPSMQGKRKINEFKPKCKIRYRRKSKNKAPGPALVSESNRNLQREGNANKKRRRRKKTNRKSTNNPRDLGGNVQRSSVLGEQE